MTDTTGAETRKLDIGRVIGGTFSVIGRNFVTFAVLGLILAGLPTGLMYVLQTQAMTEQLAAMQTGDIAATGAYFTNVGLSTVVLMITTAILQGALIHAVVQDFSGARASIGEALATGLRAFLPLIAVSLLYTLAMALGFILLIVPGIMIAIALCVCAPAVVADRSGVFGAFTRSRALTRGNRWRIFALFIVLVVLLMVVGAVVAVVAGALALTNPGALQDPAALAMNPLMIALNVVQQTLSAVIGAALISVLYVELRQAKEGLGAKDLADIFS
ncbi:YciC family protein [Phenylobacterium sp.]|uniref:YciC family protein n=1 Tax=Phenylobacterium sp. TaxID=1871053 RepID=UPI00301D8218